jgi:WhiB family redox-sensing transcriptional regulator
MRPDCPLRLATRAQEDDMADIRRLPTPVAEVWDWQLHGACRGESTSLFVPPDGERGPARARRQAAAKAVCAKCPVIDACLKHALSVREPYGVWGGMSEEERARLIAAEPAAVAAGV